MKAKGIGLLIAFIFFSIVLSIVFVNVALRFSPATPPEQAIMGGIILAVILSAICIGLAYLESLST